MLLSEWLSEQPGRGAALARHLKVPPSMVSKMASGEKRVPLDRCPYIQQFTGDVVTCEELRPDQVGYFRLIREQAGARARRPFGDVDRPIRRVFVQGAS
jgi:DNA-binding transcriptional regulator YdaS (Cro superfamily)